MTTSHMPTTQQEGFVWKDTSKLIARGGTLVLPIHLACHAFLPWWEKACKTNAPSYFWCAIPQFWVTNGIWPNHTQMVVKQNTTRRKINHDEGANLAVNSSDKPATIQSCDSPLPTAKARDLLPSFCFLLSHPWIEFTCGFRILSL